MASGSPHPAAIHLFLPAVDCRGFRGVIDGVLTVKAMMDKLRPAH
jgi:hypothetical protein